MTIHDISAKLGIAGCDLAVRASLAKALGDEEQRRVETNCLSFLIARVQLPAEKPVRIVGPEELIGLQRL